MARGGRKSLDPDRIPDTIPCPNIDDVARLSFPDASVFLFDQMQKFSEYDFWMVEGDSYEAQVGGGEWTGCLLKSMA